MIERMNVFRNISRNAVYSALALVSIAGIAIGYVYFYSSTMDPSLRNRDKLISELADARKSLVVTRKVSDLSPVDFQSQLGGAQSQLATWRANFLTTAQASQIPDSLYQEAEASHVQMVDVQTQTVTTQTVSSPFIVSTIRFQAQGDSYQLVDFVSHMKETSLKGIVVTNLGIAQDKNTAKLTMDMTLFTAPTIAGDLRLAVQPTPTTVWQPTATPIPLTTLPSVLSLNKPLPIPSTSVPIVMPTPPLILYVVRSGDTLVSLARQYRTNVDFIMKANGLATQNIFAGQTIVMPGR